MLLPAPQHYITLNINMHKKLLLYKNYAEKSTGYSTK